MFDKKMISQIDDWSHVDYVCIKSKEKISMATYYLEGHPIFEEKISSRDIEFVKFVGNIKCYGIAEKILGETDEIDRFYIRVNVKKDWQEKSLIDYLTRGKVLSEQQKDIIEYLGGLNTVIGFDNDYNSLYYCGFSKRKNETNLNKIRLYFKTFGLDENIRYDKECIHYLEQCQHIKNDIAFKIVRDLIRENKTGLRCIGVEIEDCILVKLKYYLCKTSEENKAEDLLMDLSSYPEYSEQIGKIMDIWDDIKDMNCDEIQVSSGYGRDDKSINVYLYKNQREKKKYYSMREGMILRNIGGVLFLINIHEKNYYDLKKLYSINETGQVIIQYIMETGVCTLDGIVSHLQSRLLKCDSKFYDTIYTDCKNFIEFLKMSDYLQEVN